MLWRAIELLAYFVLAAVIWWLLSFGLWALGQASRADFGGYSAGGWHLLLHSAHARAMG